MEVLLTTPIIMSGYDHIINIFPTFSQSETTSFDPNEFKAIFLYYNIYGVTNYGYKLL